MHAKYGEVRLSRLSLELVYAMHKTGLYGFIDRLRDYASLIRARKAKSLTPNGEDLFLLEYFGDRKGLYIEIGGNDPFTWSNTYLLYRNGWSGLVVEPISRLCSKHRRFRPRDTQVNAAVGEQPGSLMFYEMIPSLFSTCDENEANQRLTGDSLDRGRLLRKYAVPMTTVAELYRKHLAPNPVLLLAIDTEGHDLAVLRGINFEELRPEVVIFEANDERTGLEIGQFLAGHGYTKITELGNNWMFSSCPA